MGTIPRPKFKARPTTYRGIRMRSRLEASVAQYFDECGMAWEYEPQCFADETGQYLPDFRLERDDGLICYVEVKPFMPAEGDAIYTTMKRIWSSEPDVMLAVYTVDEGVLVNDPMFNKWMPFMEALRRAEQFEEICNTLASTGLTEDQICEWLNNREWEKWQ